MLLVAADILIQGWHSVIEFPSNWGDESDPYILSFYEVFHGVGGWHVDLAEYFFEAIAMSNYLVNGLFILPLSFIVSGLAAVWMLN